MSKLTYNELVANFPFDKYPVMRNNQDASFRLIAKEDGNVLLEAPPGSGKTVIGMTFLKTLQSRGDGPLFYITPTKAGVDQVFRQYPDDVAPAYGRGEYDCLYYQPKQTPKANEIPCLFNVAMGCPHYVDQATGETHTPGATPCPYYQAKFLGKRKDIVACTDHFFVFTQLFSREWEPPAGLVIDEADTIAKIVRSCLSYDITDYYLRRIIEMLNIPEIDTKKERAVFRRFLARMMKIARRRKSKVWGLLEDKEIVELVSILEQIDPNELKKKIMQGIREGKIDQEEQMETLKHLQTVTHDLRRYIHSLEYSLEGTERTAEGVKRRGGALNYTAGYYIKKRDENRRVQYTLRIRSHFVAALIRKRLLSPGRTLSYSGTVGSAQVFSYENGINSPFHALPSEFPIENTRIYMPTDTANLNYDVAGKRPRFVELARIAKQCKMLARQYGLRSLILVPSNEERDALVDLCKREQVDLITNSQIPAKQAVAEFQSGYGEVLAGTMAHFGRAIDLPNQLAPFIFMLRPAWPRMDDPEAQFETKKFGNSIWQIWKWRVMVDSRQGRARNIRNDEDKGVTIYMSQSYREFVYGMLPEYLRPAYKGQLTFTQCIDDALVLFGKKQ